MPVINLKNLNAADWITLVRIAAIPFVILTTLLGSQIVTGVIVTVALATDMIDGIVARRFNLQTKHGALLDSIADASLFLTAAFSITWFFTDFIVAHLLEITLVMGLYLFQLIFAFVRYGKPTSFHTYSAKLAACAEGLFIILCFFYGPIEWLFYVTWVIGMIEEIEEITLMFMLPRDASNVKGLYWVMKKKRVLQLR